MSALCHVSLHAKAALLLRREQQLRGLCVTYKIMISSSSLAASDDRQSSLAARMRVSRWFEVMWVQAFTLDAITL